MKNKLGFMILVMVLTFGFVLSGCATAGEPATEDLSIPKTLIITGFNLSVEGVREIQVKLTGDWVEEQDTWIVPAGCDNAQLNGQTLTADLFVWNSSGKRWTGTGGGYGVNIEFFPTEKGISPAYRYQLNMPGEYSVTIKDAETILEWSDFVFGWNGGEE